MSIAIFAASSTEVLTINQLFQGGKSPIDANFERGGLRLGNILTMLPSKMTTRIARRDHMQDRKLNVLAKKKARSVRHPTIQ